MTLHWIAKTLHRGTWTHVSNRLRPAPRQPLCSFFRSHRSLHVGIVHHEEPVEGELLAK